MTTKEIANRLVELNRNQDYKQAYVELYSPDIVSIENWGDRMEFKGMDAIKQKGEQWEAGLEEMHEMKCSDPLVADNSFAVTFYMDVTFKDQPDPSMNGRSQLTELAVYRVKDGKIYKEEFFG